MHVLYMLLYGTRLPALGYLVRESQNLSIGHAGENNLSRQYDSRQSSNFDGQKNPHNREFRDRRTGRFNPAELGAMITDDSAYEALAHEAQRFGRRDKQFEQRTNGMR